MVLEDGGPIETEPDGETYRHKVVYTPRPPGGFVSASTDTISELVVLFMGCFCLIIQSIGWLFYGLEVSWALVIAGGGLLGLRWPLHADARRRNGGQ